MGESAAVGVTGPKGPVGPNGPEGPRGNAGPTGAQGPQGLMGARGSAGAAGPAGPKGPKGFGGGVTGPQGPQGPKGPAGPTGPAGPKGESGSSMGAAGPQGGTGAAGETGPIGDTGPTGPVADAVTANSMSAMNTQPPSSFVPLQDGYAPIPLTDLQRLGDFKPLSNSMFQVPRTGLYLVAYTVRSIAQGSNDPPKVALFLNSVMVSQSSSYVTDLTINPFQISRTFLVEMNEGAQLWLGVIATRFVMKPENGARLDIVQIS